MSYTRICKCDAKGCSSVKGESNRWWVARITATGEFRAAPIETANESIEQVNDKHFCGPGCVQIFFNDYVDKMTQQSIA